MKIAIFASGNGSNAENIIRYFRARADEGIEVALVVCNRPGAMVISRASALGVPVATVSAADLRSPDTILPLLDGYGIGAIILAGMSTKPSWPPELQRPASPCIM